MIPACPHCLAAITYEEHGDLFSITCPNCGLLKEGTCNPRAESGPILTVKATTPVSVTALKILREEIQAARNVSLEKMRGELISDFGFWLGQLPNYRADELRDRLAPVGVRLESLPHEEG